MDFIEQYQSSSEDESPVIVPPPTGLFEEGKEAVGNENALHLPPVVPVSGRIDNFLVHVGIPVEHPRRDEFVRRLLAKARLRMVGNTVKTGFCAVNDFHISVAKPVTIREAIIPSLVSDLRHKLSNCGSLDIELRPGVQGYINGSKRRVFIAAPLTEQTSEIVVRKLVMLVDGVFKKYGLPPFFDEPKLHMSFGWTEKVDVLPQFLNTNALDNDAIGHQSLQFTAKRVKCSIGKSIYFLPLVKHEGNKKSQIPPRMD